ncbi:MAG: putative nucleotidyltransferase substrate binding domain-containing protein, partial [Vogesella sp.]|uniref:putative nucleotidyltransferase substrate binding domain-containing protein n=1 Tax=Vogesella sp. TaxID=1904252 RepID=UPI003F318975
QGLRDQLYRWLYLPDGDALMNLAIFVDAEAVAGDHALLAQGKHYLQSLLSDDESFYARFARAIEQFDTPLGFFAQLLTREQNGEATLDIKKGGIFPIVHGIRSLALRHDIAANNTFERLQRLAENGHLDRDFANDINETLAFLLGLRLSHGLAELADGRPASNLIRPDKLSTLEKDLLKDALALVKKFKSLLRHQFRLGAVA